MKTNNQTHLKTMVVYDGSCGLCANNAQRLLRMDWCKKFEIAPYQSDEIYRRFPRLRREECEKAVHIIMPDARIIAGGDAMRRIFLGIPLTFLLGVLLSIPPLPWLFRKFYRMLAANRHKLSKACGL